MFSKPKDKVNPKEVESKPQPNLNSKHGYNSVEKLQSAHDSHEENLANAKELADLK